MILRILLGDVLVGHLERQEHGRTVFRFDEAYLKLPERPVLGRWFEDNLGPAFEYTERGSRIPPFFQNYLPEEHSALRGLLARRAGVKLHHELPLLAALGSDLPGAIVVSAEERLSTPAAEARDSVPAPTKVEEQPLWFSLTGMQLKFPVVQRQSRFALPLNGQGGDWIAKLPDRALPGLPANEFSILSWAREIGIQVPEFKLVSIANIDGLPGDLRFGGERQALVIRRFDRGEAGARIHQENLAQVLNVRPGKKQEGPGYTTLAKTIHTVCGEADYYELVRRLVFVVLSGNADANLKDWSLIYPDGRRPQLSPAYDLVCTLAYGKQLDQHLGLQLLGQRDFDRITKAHFERLAEKVGVSPERTGQLMKETAEHARDAWERISSELPIDPQARVILDNHLNFIQI
jgi:serine/threonine-protein kinase HipA